MKIDKLHLNMNNPTNFNILIIQSKINEIIDEISKTTEIGDENNGDN